jgi:hypothetical protein
MGAEVVDVLKWVVRKHGPALKTLDREQLSGRRRVTLQRYEPLEDGQEAWGTQRSVSD